MKSYQSCKEIKLADKQQKNNIIAIDPQMINVLELADEGFSKTVIIMLKKTEQEEQSRSKCG